MTPRCSRRRTRWCAADTDRPTRSARSVYDIRPSPVNAATIARSISSTARNYTATGTGRPRRFGISTTNPARRPGRGSGHRGRYGGLGDAFGVDRYADPAAGLARADPGRTGHRVQQETQHEGGEVPQPAGAVVVDLRHPQV